MSHSSHHYDRFKEHSWSTLWKTALVRLPRAVPIGALHFTSPEGPQPFVLNLPSREQGRTIPLYVFVPPVTFPNLKEPNPVPNPHIFPVVTDYHGGGFYLGSCLEQAPFCAMLSRELQAVVISVDYRMAPLDPFPAAIEDADDVAQAVLNPQAPGYDALRGGISNYLREKWYKSMNSHKDREDGKAIKPPQPQVELDRTRIAFSGASSGGNIALNMAISAPASYGLPEWPSPIPEDYSTQVPLLLLYPSLDLRQLPSERFRNKRLPPLPAHKRLDLDDHLAATYVTRETAGHTRASPGLADTRDCLHKNAKILLVLSGIDTLWEQSMIWVDKVKREGRGGDVYTMRYEDRKHGWTTIPEIALSAEERRTRLEVHKECIHFTKAAWDGRDPVQVLETECMRHSETHDEDTTQDQSLAGLIDLGFSPQLAAMALTESKGDFEAAMTWLFEKAAQERQVMDQDGDSGGTPGPR